MSYSLKEQMKKDTKVFKILYDLKAALLHSFSMNFVWKVYKIWSHVVGYLFLFIPGVYAIGPPVTGMTLAYVMPYLLENYGYRGNRLSFVN